MIVELLIQSLTSRLLLILTLGFDSLCLSVTVVSLSSSLVFAAGVIAVQAATY